ncbi:hypothetical protein DFJ63DRAFT_334169 [Scheffersomyces coipomensis]|uniref:uncharacterized protein n=1 Tax=Scheffersomyces coipomensis TaxID=1788519 RepID=UPI00315CF2A6
MALFDFETSGSLPQPLQQISNIVLLVDKITNTNLDTYLLPDIPVQGKILHHNDPSVPYEKSSKLFFDNIAKFYKTNYTITLQFKFGIDEDGSSMTDLINLANNIAPIGCFNFKIYIFKIVGDKPNEFKLPANELLKPLNCIGFRFDTNYLRVDKDFFNLVKKKLGPEESYDPLFMKRIYDDYNNKIKYHIPICPDWLSNDLEELHLGQQVFISGWFFYNKHNNSFPNLKTVSIECYETYTKSRFEEFIQNHCLSIKMLTLRDFPLGSLYGFKKLEKLVMIGRTSVLVDTPTYDHIKEIHFYGKRTRQFKINLKLKPKFGQIRGFEVPWKEHYAPDMGALPDALQQISDIVLLVNKLGNTNLDDYLIPDIPLFFDNVDKFDKTESITITLQFKFGIDEDGSSMNDLLKLANTITPLGCLKFKIYIFKIVGDKPNEFKLPDDKLFKPLNCIGFRFDTNYLSFKSGIFPEDQISYSDMSSEEAMQLRNKIKTRSKINHIKEYEVPWKIHYSQSIHSYLLEY